MKQFLDFLRKLPAASLGGGRYCREREPFSDPPRTVLSALGHLLAADGMPVTDLEYRSFSHVYGKFELAKAIVRSSGLTDDEAYFIEDLNILVGSELTPPAKRRDVMAAMLQAYLATL